MSDLPMPQAGQMARSKSSGQVGQVISNSIGWPLVAVRIPATPIAWMSNEDFHDDWEIVKPCCECGGTGYKAVTR